MPDIEFRTVSKRFGDTLVLERISLRVEHGKGLGLFGPSGSGKTTVLRLIAGLERADFGEIVINGKSVIQGWCEARLKGLEVGMVFQDLALWPHMNMERHLEFVLRGRGLSRKERLHRAHALLEFCGLDGKRRAYPASLSGGEQQRLAIARALVTEPDVLLLDEPFANLDETLRERFVEEFNSRKTKKMTTLVISSHDRGDFARLADQVVEMSRPSLADTERETT
ncbi:MAG: ATP-binding cassette domain-containing protein [Candidatus Hydrogenedentes bacterium]|nr:ATP-binding cassette domain-containing protein [Candidatus Hydrogenedentota bacterium]